jgi:hypothetical protein
MMNSVEMKLKPTKMANLAFGVLSSSRVSGSLFTLIHAILVAYRCVLISLNR